MSSVESVRDGGENVLDLGLRAGVEDVTHAAWHRQGDGEHRQHSLTSVTSSVLTGQGYEGKIVWFAYKATTAGYLRIHEPEHEQIQVSVKLCS